MNPITQSVPLCFSEPKALRYITVTVTFPPHMLWFSKTQTGDSSGFKGVTLHYITL
uniref:Uncharacterized protein n=1 Tax=Anguilla anguilla TaxID=7936 RepID=A0A0E9Y0I6_ANGAN